VVSQDWVPSGILTAKYSASGDSLWVRYDSAQILGGNWSQAIVCVPGGVCIGSAIVNRGDEEDIVTQFLADGTEEWAQSLNCSSSGRGYAVAYDVALDQEGNVISVGYLNQTTEYTEFTTAKYSPTGDLLWLRMEHGFTGGYDQAFKVKVDSSDDVYVTGWSEGESTGYDYLTVKYDPAGNKLWARRYDGPAHAEDCPNDLVVDNQGNVIVTGRSFGGPTGFDYATVKYSPSGDELWVRRYSGAVDSSYDEAEALAVDSLGSVYVTGGAEQTPYAFSGATIRYDPDGAQRWVSICELGDSATFFPTGLALDAEGGIHLCGDGGISFVVARLNPDGETAWTRSVPTPWQSVTSYAFDGTGRACMCGGSPRGDSCITVVFSGEGQQMWQRWVRGAVNGALAVGTGGLTFVASLLRTDRVSTVFDAYDSLGRLRWTDTSSCGIMSVAANSTGRVAAAGGKLGALATMLLAPRLAITEPPDQRTRKQALSVQACPSVFADLVHLQVRSEPSRFVSLRVFDRSGRLVRNLGDMVASSGVVDWDGRDEGGRPIGSGVYFVRVESFAPGAGNADKRSTAVVKVTKVGGCSLDKRGGDAMTKLQ
jgi:hypothetical protein